MDKVSQKSKPLQGQGFQETLSKVASEATPTLVEAREEPRIED